MEILICPMFHVPQLQMKNPTHGIVIITERSVIHFLNAKIFERYSIEECKQEKLLLEITGCKTILEGMLM